MISRSAKLGGVLAAIALSFGVVGGRWLARSGRVGGGRTDRARREDVLLERERTICSLTSKHGFTLNERGSASGTVTGTIYVHLTIVSTDRVTAEVNIYPARRLDHGRWDGELPRGGAATASFSGSIVDRSRERELRRCPRIGAELQRHDRPLERRDHRARRAAGCRTDASRVVRRAPGRSSARAA